MCQCVSYTWRSLGPMEVNDYNACAWRDGERMRVAPQRRGNRVFRGLSMIGPSKVSPHAPVETQPRYGRICGSHEALPSIRSARAVPGEASNRERKTHRRFADASRRATKRKMPRAAGHVEGARRAEETVEACRELGVEVRTRAQWRPGRGPKCGGRRRRSCTDRPLHVLETHAVRVANGALALSGSPHGGAPG